MDREGHVPPATVPGSSTVDSSEGGDLLLIVGDGRLVTCRLPAGREVVLGRDAGCDIVLDHAEVSRRHAAVRGGSPPTVMDLGSTNGIRLSGGRPPAETPVPIGPGESFKLGPFLAQVVRPMGTPGVEPSPARAQPAAMLVTDPTVARDTPVLLRIAESTVNVLILGETGVGKEVLAQTIHRLSKRRGRFLGVNCAAFSESLLDSELFGHERGAFTGAIYTKSGVFEAADRGTLLLDEIGELPPGMQAKLLRVLETRQVMRVGSTRPIDIDVRFVAATNRDLHGDVARGTFRQDLYFRLNGIALRVPPLRERPGAISALAREILGKTGRVPRLSAQVLALLKAHSWPGNVRELRNVIERAALLMQDDEIRPEHILLEREDASPSGPPEDERARIIAALEACAGNQTRAARLLGVSRATLVNRLTLYDLARPRRR